MTTPDYLLSDGVITVDLEFLLSVAGDDTDYIKMMLDIFLETIPGVINEMITFCDAGDWGNLQKKAHFTKSSLSVIKVDQMMHYIVEIEENCKIRTNLDSMHFKVMAVADYYEKAKNILTDYKSKIV